MLQIEELLQLADEEPLGGFSWGQIVCDELNQYLSKERELTGATTGKAALAKIRTLPINVLVRISVMYLNPKTNEIYYADEEDPDSPPRPPESPPRPPDTQEPQPPVNTVPKKDEEDTLRGKIMMMIASTVVIIALWLTHTVVNTKGDGKEVKSSTLEVAIQVLGEVFGATANSTSGSSDGSSSDNQQNDNEPVNRPPRSDDPGPSYGN